MIVHLWSYPKNILKKKKEKKKAYPVTAVGFALRFAMKRCKVILSILKSLAIVHEAFPLSTSLAALCMTSA